MERWLLDHVALAYAVALLAGFSLAAAWETWRPLRPSNEPVGRRWARNFSLFFMNHSLVSALLPFFAVGAAMQAQAQGWGLFNQFDLHWAALALGGLLLLDFVHWAIHLTLHRVGWLWRLHQVHHSDLEYDCTIGLRFHPAEAVLTALLLMAAVIALGLPPAVVLASELLTLLSGFLVHANVSLPAGVDALLRRVVVTPDLHRVHHSAREYESMSNFGAVLSVWDRAFGSLRAGAAGGPLGMTIGLAELRDPTRLTLWRLLWLPWRREPAPGAGSSQSA